MIKIGITGSLASGKSTVAKMISSGKYPLYNADRAVKKIYQTNIFQAKVSKKFKRSFPPPITSSIEGKNPQSSLRSVQRWNLVVSSVK